MSFTASVVLRDLSFSHDRASTPLISGVTAHLSSGFTGIAGANGAGKTTLLRLICGELKATAGTVELSGAACCCEQRTDDAPEHGAGFIEDWHPDAFELRGRLGIQPDFIERWHTLSHGERKRVQIGSALWQRPDILAIDEPTNHIDASARELLIGALRDFRGVGVIVSHDRALLDALCTQMLWIDPPRVQVYPGGFSDAREQRRIARDSSIARRARAMRAYDAIEAEMQVRRERAAREHQVRSKRGIARKDSDAREKIDRARMTDGKAGAGLRQLQGRVRHARESLDATHVEKSYETGIWLPGVRSRRDWLFQIAAGSIPLGGDRALHVPDLSMSPADRIALTGNNGSGKSTLVRMITGHLNVDPQHVINMPQEIDASESVRVLGEVRRLAGAALGTLMNIVSRLGSRPGRLLESSDPSPGEIRKLLLALGMVRSPHLIILDEPTNHLDLPSIEALESALADCPCGLLMVSHDERFLARLARTRWRIESPARGDSVVQLS